jgi:hypothetical protein
MREFDGRTRVSFIGGAARRPAFVVPDTRRDHPSPAPTRRVPAHAERSEDLHRARFSGKS